MGGVKIAGRRADLRTLTRALRATRSGISVVNIDGVGGIGKTTLLLEFLNRCSDGNLPFALIDAREPMFRAHTVDRGLEHDPLAMLSEIRRQLGQCTADDPFQDFDRVLRRWRSIASRSTSDRRTPAALSDIATPGLDALGSAVGGVIAGLPGSVLGALASGSMRAAWGRLSEAGGVPSVHGLSKAEAKFINDSERLVLKALSEGMARIVDRAGAVVIAFDTIEMLEGVEPWVEELLVRNCFPAGTLVLIAGRRRPTVRKQEVWSACYERIDLRPLQHEDVSRYMASLGLGHGHDTVALAMEVSDGIPWALAMYCSSLIEQSQTLRVGAALSGVTPPSNAGGLASTDALIDMFLAPLSDSQRTFVFASSVPLTFDADLMGELLGTDSPALPDWNHVTDQSLFAKTPQGRLYLLDPVREILLQRLRAQHPKTLARWNEAARKYYLSLLDAAPSAYIWDYLYHTFYADEEALALLGLQPALRRAPQTLHVPSEDEGPTILDVDEAAMGDDPQIAYQLKDLEEYLRFDRNMFRVIDSEVHNGFAGYALVLRPRRSWGRVFERGELPQPLHPDPKSDLLLDPTVAPCDYLIDTIALSEPGDALTGARLIRAIVPILVENPRKLYVMSVSPNGDALAKKLGMRLIGVHRTALGSPIRLFITCMYEGGPGGILRDALAPRALRAPSALVCGDCGVESCAHWTELSQGLRSV